jgi:hypothetical protein
MKCCCAPCAVFFHQGAGLPLVLACCFGPCYTLICWTPEDIDAVPLTPTGGAKMER